jgi:hypothetical protein
MFPQQFREFPCINAVDGGNTMLLQPLGQTLLRRPMRMLPTVGTDNQARNVNSAALKVERQSIRIDHAFVRDAVIANERIGENENLAAIGWIRQGFGVSDHAGIEDDFTGGRNGGSKGTPFNDRHHGARIIIFVSLLQVQNCWIALKEKVIESELRKQKYTL